MLSTEIWLPVGGAAFTENGIELEVGDAVPLFDAVTAA